MMLIKLPQMFMDDHEDRDLPTPEVFRATKHHYYVRADDPALDELLSDADYYGNGGVEPSLAGLGLCASARATYRAIKAAREEAASRK